MRRFFAHFIARPKTDSSCTQFGVILYKDVNGRGQSYLPQFRGFPTSQLIKAKADHGLSPCHIACSREMNLHSAPFLWTFFCSSIPHSRAKFHRGFPAGTHARGSIRKPTKDASKQASRSGGSGTQVAAVFPLMQWPGATLSLLPWAMPMCGRRIH